MGLNGFLILNIDGAHRIRNSVLITSRLEAIDSWTNSLEHFTRNSIALVTHERAGTKAGADDPREVQNHGIHLAAIMTNRKAGSSGERYDAGNKGNITLWTRAGWI